MTRVAPPRQRTIRGLVAVALVLAGLAASMPSALAKFISSPTASHSITGHTLVTPTLTCNGTGLGIVNGRINLTWTATSDTTTADHYGTFLSDGYEVDRGTVNGGPYGTVVTTVGRTATGYQDNPGAGTFYYVIKGASSLWRSAKSNQVTGTISVLTATCS